MTSQVTWTEENEDRLPLTSQVLPKWGSSVFHPRCFATTLHSLYCLFTWCFSLGGLQVNSLLWFSK